MKITNRILITLCLLLATAFTAKSVGWPANFQGVMLQGFYWDSYKTETKWVSIEKNADEWAESFKLIWIPNSAKSEGGLGYHPVYWFTNHNTPMGTETQLLKMIETYKAKGVGFIADVVLDHRSGKSNWTDFPAEEWNGKTWKIGPEGICCDDEVAGQAGQAKPTGNYDTGEKYNGSRDLDHTNANVQDNCKNYCKCLLEKYGYVGFRLDMVKGYGAQYTKMYNQYSRPTYSVGEYWDGSYDGLAAWIEGTGRESAVFDYCLKYVLNEAFGGNDMSKLCWMENGNNPQPAGLIHHAYQQYAVTFVENHDTDGNGTNAFSGNVVAANAFILCSPGTPCIFLPHWTKYKAELKKLIAVRNKVGVTNTSPVKVLRHDRDCYMAEVTGTKGRLVVKIGSAMASPEGWNDSQIYCTGTDYCVWSTAEGGTGGGGGGGDVTTYPSTLYLQGHVNGYSWDPSKGVAATGKNGVYTFSNVNIDSSSDFADTGFISFATKLGANANDWDGVNSSARYGATSKDEPVSMGGTAPIVMAGSDCNSWAVPAGSCTIVADLAKMTLRLTDGSGVIDDPVTPGDIPTELYLIGNVNGAGWATNKGAVAKPDSNGKFTWSSVTIDDAGGGLGYFSFCTMLSSEVEDWDTVNGGDRYGAATEDETVTINSSTTLMPYPANVSAMGCLSWSIVPGTYTIVADFGKMKMTVYDPSGIEVIESDINAAPVYYNMMGVEVKNPTAGFYIMRRGGKTAKVLIK